LKRHAHSQNRGPKKKTRPMAQRRKGGKGSSGIEKVARHWERGMWGVVVMKGKKRKISRDKESSPPQKGTATKGRKRKKDEKEEVKSGQKRSSVAEDQEKSDAGCQAE